MKRQNIVEAVVYLCMLGVAPEPEIIRRRLEDAGFAEETVTYAFAWLRELVARQSWYDEFHYIESSKTIRIFSQDEICKISLEIRKFILFLEHSGILSTKTREIVINQLMQLNQHPINLIDAKWVVFFVLISKKDANEKDTRKYLNIMIQES